MQSTKIRVGGVPEHFNLPWLQATEQGAFTAENIDLNWNIYPGGTGEMNAALRNDDCDICIVLTEGIITDIINNNPSKIISGYVKTPLIWGIYTGRNSALSRLSEINSNRIAISRFGSGSHLMPMVNAKIQGETIHEDQFVKVLNLDGAIASLNKGESDIFYWEKYTTNPYVKNKILKLVGEFISPWPCFVIAATDKIIAQAPEALDKMLKIIHTQCATFMNDPLAIQTVSQRYNIDLRDASQWYHATEWATNSWVSNKMLANVKYTLREAGVIDEIDHDTPLIWKRN